jgi:cytidyltransferase-like protein
MSLDTKIKPIEELAGMLALLRAEQRTIVHCHGIFDLLHIGVIRHFEQAKKLGDVLVVSITPDKDLVSRSSHALFTQDLRAEAIAALAQVDYVAISKWPQAVEPIQMLHPDIYVPWDEDSESEEQHAQNRKMEEAVVRAAGGRVVAIDEDMWKSTRLIHQYSPSVTPEASRFLGSFCSRHSVSEVLDCVENVRPLRVLFLGELIIDEYQYCESIGKSGKEPVLAVRYVSAEKFAGGIVAAANQAATFSDSVGMLTLLGTQDSHEEFIRERLSPHVDAMFLHMPGVRTIVKRRLVEMYPFQKLFEIYLMDQEVPESVSKALYTRLKAILPNYDAVIVADYGHGMFTPEIVDLLCSQDRFLAINTQTNAANQGYNTVSKYRRADYICLSEKELRLEARNTTKDIRVLMAEIAESLSCGRMLITRGRQGNMSFHVGEGFFDTPSFTNRIVDRIGAGDALLAVTALCAARETPMEIVSFIGNAVGAQAVETVGNRNVVSHSALCRQIESLFCYDRWISTM